LEETTNDITATAQNAIIEIMKKLFKDNVILYFGNGVVRTGDCSNFYNKLNN